MKVKDNNFCYCCSGTEDDLKLFEVKDRKLHHELMSNEITLSYSINIEICQKCNYELTNSIEAKVLEDLSRICRKYCQNHLNDSQHIKEGERTTTVSQEIIEDNYLTNNDNDNDDEDDDNIPISIIREQIISQENHQIIELIEIENVTVDEQITSTPVPIEIKEFSCSSCDKKFSTEYRLKTHLRVHTKERRYLCDFKNCNMRFTQLNALKCHKRIHLNERPYICPYECGKSFTQSTILKTHVAAKHVGNSIECDVPGCEKKFARSSFMLLHKKRDHENVRNYNCMKCDKQYKQQSHLTRHIESAHMNIRHVCTICTKSFSKSWSLKMHQFKHSSSVENLPYKCSECKMGFERRDKWLKHLKKIHPGIEVKKDPVEINLPKNIINKS